MTIATMPCPKCTDRHGKPTPMLMVDGYSAGSSLVRGPGEEVYNDIVPHYSCWRCGSIRSADTKPIITERVPIPPSNYAQRTPQSEINKLRDLLINHKPAIEAMLADGKSWRHITEKLGTKCHWKTIQNHFTGKYRNSKDARYNQIKAEVAGVCDHITELRSQRVMWTKIYKGLGLKMAISTVKRFYHEIMAGQRD